MPKIQELETVHLETMPDRDKMEHGKIYVSRKFRLAIHLCACGECGYETVTPLVFDTEEDIPPRWNYNEVDGKVTLNPSIGNWNMPCKSHYWLHGGKIVWC